MKKDEEQIENQTWTRIRKTRNTVNGKIDELLVIFKTTTTEGWREETM